jgi:hypothetical protein
MSYVFWYITPSADVSEVHVALIFRIEKQAMQEISMKQEASRIGP